MGIEKENEFIKVYKKSVEHLESMSALELMKNAASFTADLEKLMAMQRLPVPVLVGCLMTMAYSISADADNMLLDAKLTESFMSFKKYVDTNFMKKE